MDSDAEIELPPAGVASLLLWGIAWPFLTFSIGLSGVLVPRYRGGVFPEMARMLLGGRALALFLPAILFAWYGLVSVQCGAVTPTRRRRLERALWVGSTTGAGFTLVLLFGYPPIVGAAMGTGLVTLGPPCYRSLATPPKDLKPTKSADLLRRCAIVVVAGLLASLWVQDASVMALFLMVPFLCAPGLLSVTCWAVLRRLQHECPPPAGHSKLGPIAMAAAILAHWAWAIQWALIDYAALEKHEPGDCYVANAAAHGYPWLVGSTPFRGQLGAPPVNQQLRTLKAGEIALRTIAPRFHRAIRVAYDAVGPPIAARVSGPFRASLAYATLLPIAAATRMTLIACVPNARERIDALYGGR